MSSTVNESEKEGHLRWLETLASERSLRAAIAEFSEGKPSRAKKKALRLWWASVEAVMQAYVTSIAAGSAVSPAPLDVLTVMKGMAGYLAVGKIPGPIGDAAAEGRSSAGPTERRDLILAVAYLLAAKSVNGFEYQGRRIKIDDKSPVKTICEAYGVHKVTVNGWQKTVAPKDLGINAHSAESLTNCMRTAGKRYREKGRSAAALSKRDSKRN